MSVMAQDVRDTLGLRVYEINCIDLPKTRKALKAITPGDAAGMLVVAKIRALEAEMAYLREQIPFDPTGL